MARQSEPPELQAEEAMNRVLDAEAGAAEAIRDCERAAERRVTDAREQARRTAERTDERISRLRVRCAKEAKRQTQAILEGEERVEASITLQAAQQALLDEAVRRLAARLTTAEQEDRDADLS